MAARYFAFTTWNRSARVFIDQARLYVKGGDGGPGCVSFRREKSVARGGPDGGDGGDGGSVILKAGEGLESLIDFRYRREYVAQSGRPGSGAKKKGRAGEDWVVNVPCGTVVRDLGSGLVLKDLTVPDGSVVVARGGRGGRGNKSFATSTNRAPRTATPGEPGQERRLGLELKLIADVGLVGLPNAGKSTLLSHVSAARPKIADYPFTTRHPHLGLVELSDFRRFVMADIPGLIEGAHQGVGLGDEFLRHIERTRVLVHVVDLAAAEPTPMAAYEAIRHELREYSPALAERPCLVAANKMDVPQARQNAQAFESAIAKPVHQISAVTGEGLPALLEALYQRLASMSGGD